MASTHDNTTPMLPTGTVVDDTYEVLGMIGSGGMAQIYRAQPLSEGPQVAIKLLRADFSSEEARLNQERRLWNEARAVASIEHPNVVRVFDLKPTITLTLGGKSGTWSCPYMVLELLEGQGLFEEIQAKGAMTPTRALPLFLGALEGLSEGHQKGIIHKDLKPENLFLVHPGTDQEALIILDFGTARMGEQMTTDGKLPFTPQYTAPEYFEGHTVTPALDVYQMGLVLIEMLTGRPAVPHDELIACLMAHQSGDLAMPDWLKTSPVGPIIKSATDPKRDLRIQNATIFYKVLSRIDPASLHPLA